MKKKFWVLALIGLFVTAAAPSAAPADNEPPYWTPCPTSTTTPTTPTTIDPTATDTNTTTTNTMTTPTGIKCPEIPPATTIH
ncbi:hypothetical protein [Tumebacillus flagellatus]|uniref:Uncharacterized protein n=1 Tax=Tumebacillus flagellatus TaxID=1157490 RepID=A0A074LQF7_9BACL|nr:hypothetical protein [Tumebacillus flagellatus]KEO84381.1 hypothetical protein EL26_04565 [Tumebacillus flagellatus]